MIKQLIINGKKSYDDFDLYISQRTISQPKKKSIKESVPFSNVVYDFSDINGEIYWEQRTLQYVFDFAELSTEEVEIAKSKALTWLMNVHDTDIYDPYIGDYHFHGSFESDSWSEDFGAGTLTINFSVYPYKISNSDTSIIEEIGDELTGSSPLTINNSASDDLESLTIYGNSEQETRSGRNKFNFEDKKSVATGVTVDEDGWITITYDNTSGEKSIYQNYYTNNLDLATSKTYAIVLEIKNVSGTGNLWWVSNYNTEGQFSSNGANSTFENLTNNSVLVRTATTKADFTDVENGIRTFASFDIGDSGSVTFRLSVLEDTTITANTFEYEAFGVSPSPDYPSEVKTVKGVTNLFDKDNPNLSNLYPGGSTFISNANYKSIYIEIEPNTTYTIYRSIYRNEDIVVGTSINIPVVNGAITNKTSSSTNKPITITSGENDKYLTIYYCWTATNEEEIRNSIMIEEGDVSHSYVPYGTWLRVDTKSPNLYNFKDKKEQSNGVTVDEDGWITCTYDNSLGSKSVFLNYYTNNLDLKVSTNYIVVAEIKEVIGNGILYPFSQHGDTGGQFLKSANLTFDKLSNGLVRVCNGTTKSSFNNVDYGLRSFVEFRAGESGSITFRLSVLEDITITADKFKYSSYENDLILIDMKKPNLFNYEAPTSYTNGLSYTKNDDGSFVASGTINSTWANLSQNGCIPTPLKVGTYNIKHTNLIHNISVIFTFEDGTESSRYSLKGKHNVIATFEKVVTKARFFVEGLTSGNAYTIEDNIKIYEGKGTDDYYELCAIGDTKDELFLDKSTNKITQRIGKIVLDGSESGWEYTEAYNYFRCPTFNFYGEVPLQNKNQKCTHFEVVTDWGSGFRDKTNKNAIFSLADTGYKICVRNTSYLTVDEFVTWLSENPVEVYYELATPVEINNEVITLPKTFDDGTIITINDELEVSMNVTYNEKKTLIIDNISSHRVTPTIMVEGDLTIELNNTSYGLSTGTYNNGLYLESGINEVILRGTGKIKFSYVEEVL